MTTPSPTGRRGLPLTLAIAVFAIALGVFALTRGFGGGTPKSASAPAVPASATKVGDIAVYGAYVREPASAETAAAYLVITNTGDKTDTWTSVSSGASTSAMMMNYVKASSASGASASGATGSSGGAQADGAETMIETPTVEVKPGQTVTFKPGAGHIMLQGLIGAIKPGQTVNLLLHFERAGSVAVSAPVIAIGAAPPKN